MRRCLTYILFVLIASCAQPPPRERDIKKNPEFSTEVTNPELKVITEEYFRLSTRNKVVFNNKVSIGFSNIERGRVIGTCTFRSNFREIDLDRDFWKKASWDSKVALVYHELTHCYCERDHDFDDGQKYPDDSLTSIIDRILVKQPITPLKPDGYLFDDCPKSIMHPVILDDECFLKHYDYYVKEMFNRCEPF